jgi:hypothetical protein
MPITQPTVTVLLTRLDGKIDSLSDQVKEIKEKLYGNGSPGIIIDQVNQDNRIDKLLEIAEKNAGNIEELKKETVGKFLTRNWRTLLMLAVAFFLILHSLIPADLSLWTWFSRFFGGG